MVFPPPILPTNRTNADPQQDTHPSDHNSLALAINDIVAFIEPPVSEMQVSRLTNNTVVNETWVPIVALNTLDYSQGDGLSFGGAGSEGIVALIAGRYLVTGYGWFDANTAGTKRAIAVAVGSPGIFTAPQLGVPPLAPPLTVGQGFLTFAMILTVPAGGLIQLWAWQNSGATLFFNNGTFSVRHLP